MSFLKDNLKVLSSRAFERLTIEGCPLLVSNKEKVKDRAAELLKETGDGWMIGTTARALTELYENLPKEEVDQLQTIANEWNHMGPGEAVQLE